MTTITRLPEPPGSPMLTAREIEWHKRGNCQYTDPDLFFPELGTIGEPAKRICRQCPVRLLCLGQALSHGEEWGIWGGLSREERAVARKLRRRGATLTQIIGRADNGELLQQTRGALGRAVTIENRRKAREAYLAAGEKPCTACKNVKRLSEYTYSARDGYYAQCKQCRSAAAAAKTTESSEAA